MPRAPRRRPRRAGESRRRAPISARRAPTRRVRRRARTGSRPAGGSPHRSSSPRSARRMWLRARLCRFRLGRMCNIDTVIRIAAAGDIHASEATRERVTHAFEQVESDADVILLAGDLTTTGEPDQARVLADACRELSIPVFAVLGNHDYHAGRAGDIGAVLEEAGINVLDRSAKTCTIAGLELGVVGAKGFVGGFPGSALPDFGEPLLRSVYAETTHEADAIGKGLQEIVHCDLRVVLLHYAPVAATIAGEPEGIHVLLGSDRL